MAFYARNEYTSDGTTTDYLISFAGVAPGYLSEDHVKYYLDGVLQSDVDRVFIDSTHIRITAPTSGALIKFQRGSNIETPLVDWLSGAGVSAYNLDKNTLQMLYIGQESADAGAGLTTDIDAAVIAAQNAQALAEAAQAGAEVAEAGALAYADSALDSAVAALASKDAATASEVAALASELAASASAIAADASATLASTYQAEVEAEGDTQVALVLAEGDTQVARLDTIVESADLNKSVRQTMLTGPDLKGSSDTIETSATKTGELRNTYHDLDMDMLTGSRGGMILTKYKGVDGNILQSSLLSEAQTYLATNLTQAETALDNRLQQFTASGVQLAGGGGLVDADLYAFMTNRDEVIDGNRWQWNDESGFFMCTYVGTGVARELQHPMGKAPMFFALKNIEYATGTDWATQRYGSPDRMKLNDTVDELFLSSYFPSEATAEYLSIGSSITTNGAGQAFFLFGWAGEALDDIYLGMRGKRGVTASWIHGPSTAEPVDLGFEPEALIIKTIGTGAGWQLRNKAKGHWGKYTYLDNTTAEEKGVVVQSGTEFTLNHPAAWLVIAIGSTADAPVNKRKNGAKGMRKVGTEAAGNSVHLGAAFKNGTDGGMVFGRPVDSVRENSLCDTIRGNYRLRTDDNSIQSAFTAGFNSTGIVPGTSASWNSTGINQYAAFNTTQLATIDGNLWAYNPLTGFAMCIFVGTGVERALNHPMNKLLCMSWVKNTAITANWRVRTQGIAASAGNDGSMLLNTDGAVITTGSPWQGGIDSLTSIEIGALAAVNGVGHDIALYAWFGDDLSDLETGMYGTRGVTAFFSKALGAGPWSVETGIDDIQAVLVKASSTVGDWVFANMKTGTYMAMNDTYVETVGTTQLTVEGSVLSFAGSGAADIEYMVFGSTVTSGIDNEVILPASTDDPAIVSMANGFNAQGNVDIMKKIIDPLSLGVTGDPGQKFLYVQEDGTLGWTDIRPEYLRGYYPGVTGSHVYDIDKAVMYNARGYDKPIVQAWIEHPTYTGATIDGNDIWYPEADITGAIRRALFYNAMEVGKSYRVRGRVTSFNETSGGTLYLPYTSGGSTPTQPNIGEFDYECTATSTTLSTQVSSDVYGHIIIDSIEEIITDEITPLVFIGECWLDANGDVYDIRTYAKGDFWVSDLFDWTANTSYYFDLPFGHAELSMYLVGTNPSGVAEEQNYVEIGGFLRGAHNYYREDTLQVVTAQYPVSSSTYTDLKLYTRRNF